MDDYVEDKKLIYRGQRSNQITLCPYDDKYGEAFFTESKAQSIYFSASPLPDSMDGVFLTAANTDI